MPRRELHPTSRRDGGIKIASKIHEVRSLNSQNPTTPFRRYGFLGQKNTRLTFHALVSCLPRFRFDLGTRLRREQKEKMIVIKVGKKSFARMFGKSWKRSRKERTSLYIKPRSILPRHAFPSTLLYATLVATHWVSVRLFLLGEQYTHLEGKYI